MIPTPEYETVPIEPGESIIILASDGLWDVFTSEDALAVAMKHPNPMSAANALGKLAVQKWNKEEGAAVDDITIIVIFSHLVGPEGKLHLHTSDSLTRCASQRLIRISKLSSERLRKR